MFKNSFFDVAVHQDVFIFFVASVKKHNALNLQIVENGKIPY